ncbi:MAG: hypothetical protein QXU93_11720 [Thermoproteus sp.]
MKFGEFLAMLDDSLQYMLRIKLATAGYDVDELANRELETVRDLLEEVLGAHNLKVLFNIVSHRANADARSC